MVQCRWAELVLNKQEQVKIRPLRASHADAATSPCLSHTGGSHGGVRMAWAARDAQAPSSICINALLQVQAVMEKINLD